MLERMRNGADVWQTHEFAIVVECLCVEGLRDFLAVGCTIRSIPLIHNI